jgi:hypothetical protein
VAVRNRDVSLRGRPGPRWQKACDSGRNWIPVRPLWGVADPAADRRSCRTRSSGALEVAGVLSGRAPDTQTGHRRTIGQAGKRRARQRHISVIAPIPATPSSMSRIAPPLASWVGVPLPAAPELRSEFSSESSCTHPSADESLGTAMAHTDYPLTSRVRQRSAGFLLVALPLSLGSEATGLSLCDWAGRFCLSLALTCSRVSLRAADHPGISAPLRRCTPRVCYPPAAFPRARG